MAIITFVYSSMKNETVILRVQGVLDKPQNLHFLNNNSTHISILWDHPFSLMGHTDTAYEVVLINNDEISKNTTISTKNITLRRPRPLDPFIAVTAWNPVGRGGTGTLNLTNTFKDCENIGMFSIVPLYKVRESIII